MSGRGGKNRLVGTMIVVAFLVVALIFFRGVFLRLFSFIERPLAGFGTWVTDRTIRYCESLGAEEDIATLREQRDTFAVQAAETNQLRDENGQLRDQLAFVQRSGVTAIPAAVVSRQIADRAASFIIDRGSRDGLKTGMPVVVGDGMLVGKISMVTATTATVSATSDPQTATAVTLLNQSRTLGLAQGMNGTLISIRYIPNDQVLHVNDLVVTSGLEENMVSGLLVGIVNEVRTDVAAPFQEAIVEPLAEIRRFANVLVILQADVL